MALEVLNSYDKLKLGDTGLRGYEMLVQHIARDNSGLSLARRRDVYQSTGIAKEDSSRQSLENHGKLDEIRRFSNQKIGEHHDVHRNLALAEDYSRPTKRKEYQCVWSDGDSIQPFLGLRS